MCFVYYSIVTLCSKSVHVNDAYGLCVIAYRAFNVYRYICYESPLHKMAFTKLYVHLCASYAIVATVTTIDSLI